MQLGIAAKKRAEHKVKMDEAMSTFCESLPDAQAEELREALRIANLPGTQSKQRDIGQHFVVEVMLTHIIRQHFEIKQLWGDLETLGKQLEEVSNE